MYIWCVFLQMYGSLLAFFHFCLVFVLFSAPSLLEIKFYRNFFPSIYIQDTRRNPFMNGLKASFVINFYGVYDRQRVICETATGSFLCLYQLEKQFCRTHQAKLSVLANEVWRYGVPFTNGTVAS